MVTIAGIQKTTLIDFSGMVACTLFTKGCNLLCPYCHNRTLVQDTDKQEGLAEEELFGFLKKRAGLLDGVCISGGEPLIHENIGDFIGQIKELGYLIKLDTNGSYPKRLKKLARQGLIDYVAMDLKSGMDTYDKATGCRNVNMDDINESIDFLLKGDLAYEFRTTVVKGIHTREDMINISKRIGGTKAYYIQNYKDSGDILGSKDATVKLKSFNEKELAEFLKLVRVEVPKAELR